VPKISSDTRDSIVNAIDTIYTDTAKLDTFLLGVDRIRSHIINDGDKLTIVTAVVRDAEQKHWLCKLLTKLDEKNKHDNGDSHPLVLQAIASLSEESGSSNGDFYQACILSGRKHFLHRSDLRSILREFAGSNAHKVLRILGEEDSGQSYSFEFINHIYRDDEEYVRIPIDLENYVAIDSPALELVRDLSFELPWLGSVSDSPDLRPERADDLAKWFRGRVRQALVDRQIENLWLVLDNCDAPGLKDNGIYTFLKFLVDSITTLPNFRMIFLAKSDLWPDVDEEFEEIKVPRDGERKEVIKTHLQNYWTWKSNVEFDDRQLEEAAAFILDLVKARPERFFPAVALALKAWEKNEDVLTEAHTDG